jgi:poly(3-hydroxybutyrate) depolymerase
MKGLGGAMLVWAAAAAAPAMAATDIATGKSSFVFNDAKGRADVAMRVYTYKPEKCAESCTLVFAVHGVSRTASSYRDYWQAAADRYGLVIVAPEFSKKDWASYSDFDVTRQPDRDKWPYAVIEHLFDEVGGGRKDYVLFGHSAGGQFVHRMAFFMPEARARVMVAANPGWYLWPEWRKDRNADPFPYSLVGSGFGEAAVRQALQRPLILALGDKDIDPNHKDLRKTPAAERQGATRFERGQHFFAASTAAAKELDVKLAWQLIEVPGVAHSGSGMSKAAAEAVFGKR